MFYKKKGSAGSATTLTISDGATLNRTVSGLNKYKEYCVLNKIGGGCKKIYPNHFEIILKFLRMIDLTVWLRLQNGNFELGALQMLHVH